jgi:anti-sigma factor RsiW
MDIKCKNTEQLLSSYMDSELSDDHMRSVTAHLSTCRACAAKLQALQLSRKVFRSMLSGASVLTAAEQQFCRGLAAYHGRAKFMPQRLFSLEPRLWKPVLALLLFGVLLWSAGFVSLPQHDSRLTTAWRVHQAGFTMGEDNI